MALTFRKFHALFVAEADAIELRIHDPESLAAAGS